VQTEISRLVANSPALAGIRARILSLQAIGRTSGVVSAHLSLPVKSRFPTAETDLALSSGAAYFRFIVIFLHSIRRIALV
jgi:hypothetical protein